MIKQFLLEYTDVQFTIHEVLVLKTLHVFKMQKHAWKLCEIIWL